MTVVDGAMFGSAPSRAAGPSSPAAGAPRPYVLEERNVALVRAIGGPRRVLDVGCGLGQNGEVAKGRGAHVVGLELDPRAAAEARGRLDEVLEVNLEDAAALQRALGDRRFDLLLLGDVLEHVAAPEEVLGSLLGFLEPGGRVVASLPNVAAWTVRLGLLAGRFDYEPSGILDRTHLRFFTRRSAEALLEGAGLELLWVDHNPMLVRALKRWISPSIPRGGDPTAFTRSAPYQAYQALVRPLEDAVVRVAPDLLSFQHVLVARKPPARGKLSLTVGMLTMNEEESVERMIGEIRRHAPDAEILCVDSSTDRTPEIARRLGARVLRQLPPRGHGPAMELLMKTAAKESDLLVYLDCDFTYPADRIPELRRLVEEEGYDVVNCSRTRARQASMPWSHFVANRAFAALAHAAHGVPTSDVHSGMRAYRASAIRAFDFDGEGDALPIDTLLFPAKCGFRVAEIGIQYDERVGYSKLRKLAGTVWTFLRLGRAVGVGVRGAPRFERR